MSEPWFGRPLARREDARLLTGAGGFLDSIESSPRELTAHFIRSPHAHARVLSVDAAALVGMEGAEGCFTASDIDALTQPHVVAPQIAGHRRMAVGSLAAGTVRFQGDPVACVLACDRYRAEDAAEGVAIAYEPLEPVVTIADAERAESCVDPAIPDNLICTDGATHGDIDAAFATAHRVIERRFHQHRQTHLPMETRGCLARWDRGRQHLTLIIPTQMPHPLRSMTARRLGLGEEQVTIVASEAGGAFGQRLMLYREELTVAALAIALDRPVRWREDRSENLLASAHARDDEVAVSLAVDAQGLILGLRIAIASNYGAYCFFPGNYIATMIALALPGGYRIPAYAWQSRALLTNTCPIAPMRAPMAIASWAMEATIEAAAATLEIDAIAMRRANLVRDEEQPCGNAFGEQLVDLNLHACLDVAVASTENFAERQREALVAGRHIGLGLCVVVEPTTYGSALYAKAGIAGSGHEAALLRIEPSGVVRVGVGLMASGQGYETAFAQIAADELGIMPSQVHVLLGNSDVAPYGMGSRGARGGTAGGNAVALAAGAARRKLLDIAAGLLQRADAVGLTILDGAICENVGDAIQGLGLTFVDVARVAYLEPHRLRAGISPGLEFSETYDPPRLTFSNGVHLCEVDVDVETGKVDITGYTVIENAGRMINPAIVAGQSHGAVAMGLSGALCEAMAYDEAGQNRATTLADYLTATAIDLPDYRIIHLATPASGNPLGMKGMSEGGVMGAAGALCLAVENALRPFNVTLDRQPLRPTTIRGAIDTGGTC